MIDNLSMKKLLTTLTNLLNVANLNPAIDALTSREVTGKASGLFRNFLEREIRDNLNIEQFKTNKYNKNYVTRL